MRALVHAFVAAAVLSGGLLAAPRIAHADTGAEPWRPCLSASPEAHAANDALEALSSKIETLAPNADPAPLVAELNRITEGPCFLILESRTFEFDSSLSLRTFWRDGGRSYVDHVLRFDEPSSRYSYTMPTPRKTLTLESAPTHALAGVMLCAERDSKCGVESKPWRRRAEKYLEMFEETRAARVRSTKPPLTTESCEARAREKPLDQRFGAWRSCIASLGRPHAALPLGSFRAPTEGWLVVRGRRGHYNFCDEVRAYDLATGAAYVAKSCSGLALESDGTVNGERTDDGRKLTVQVGRLRVDALREAAWMMALANETQRRVVDGFGTAIPTGFPIVVPHRLYGGIYLGSYSSSSAQTTIHWSWQKRGANVVHGSLRWPEDYTDAAADHAVRLLQVAEDGFEEGCAPAALPSLQALGLVTSPSAPPDRTSQILAALALAGTSPICAR